MEKLKLKLKLKDVVHYLPFDLKGIWGVHILEIVGASYFKRISIKAKYYKQTCSYSDVKLFLKPLSDYKDFCSDAMNDLGCDLSAEIEIMSLATHQRSLANMSYSTYQIMCENHIDFNGLIEKGLAIDINTLVEA